MTSASLIDQLKASYPGAIENVVNFLGQTTLEIRKEDLKKILEALKQKNNYGYEVLMDLTGVDYLFPEKHTKVVYFLHNPENLERLIATVSVGRGGSLPSVTDLWEGAEWYERELYDLFGIHFEGHPDLKRLLMPDDWIGHPLLKDYALTEEPVQFKHGVKPKVPSQIISYVQNKNNQ